jgi:membrane protease YdiL (CAAX protease family)
MKTVILKLFRWQPSRETLIVLVAGAVVVGLSAAMLLFENWPWVRIAIRDVGQIFLVGILLPLAYIQRSGKDWAEFGFSSKKWPVFLLINLVLGVLLFFSFLSGSPPPADFRLSASTVWSAAYVMLALCFELVFFYAFLRTFFEQAFGIVPAIIMTALFYAFHHIGFQPEYGKLIFVGLLYATTYRLGNSALLIFPFFLGVGGTYDVLIQSQEVSPILYPEIRTLYLAVAILATVVWVWRKVKGEKPCMNGPVA